MRHNCRYNHARMALMIFIFYFAAFVVTIHVVLEWPENSDIHRQYASSNSRSSSISMIERVEAFVTFPQRTLTTTKISKIINRRPNPRNDDVLKNHRQGFIIRAESSSSEEFSEDRSLLEQLQAKLYEKNRDNSSSSSGSSSSDRSNSMLVGRQNWPTNDSKRLSAATAGLSKFHQSILSSVPTDRQRCVTGKYPLKISFADNPTHKWLSSSFDQKTSYCQMLVNGTSTEKSLASYDRFQWLDVQERNAMHDKSALLSLELIAEINVRKPGYVNLLPQNSAGLSASLHHSHARKRNNNVVPKFFQNNRLSPNNDHLDESSIDNNNNNNNNNSKGGGERLWITGFSLTKQSGEMHYMDLDTHAMGQVNSRTADVIRWPNEVHTVPSETTTSTTILTTTDDSPKTTQQQQQKMQIMEDALLVSDGFLVPGKDNGGLYIVRNPGHPHSEYHVCLAGGSGVDGLLNRLEDTRQTKKQQQTATTNNHYNNKIVVSGDEEDDDTRSDGSGWFYHRAVWTDLTGDGRYSILTARAKRPSSTNKAQLVWLERPKPYRYDETTNTPLDIDDTVFDPFSSRHTPWKLRVLDEGPDVMFSVADLDPEDDTIEVLASQFFNGQITLHSIQKGLEPKVVFRRTIDDACGPSFSSILADLDGNLNTKSKVIDCGSTVNTLKPGDCFSHLLVTNHKNTAIPSEQQPQPSNNNSDEIQPKHDFVTTKDNKNHNHNDSTNGINDNQRNSNRNHNEQDSLADGGSLFSYRVPVGRKDAWKTEPWVRSIVATGFRVRGQLGNMINPGAPGFCYTFYPTQQSPQHENDSSKWTRPLIGIAGDCAEAAYILRPVDNRDRNDGEQGDNKDNDNKDHSANYAMMCEIDCGATVGSIGIGYDDLSGVEQESGYAKLYIPCYEKDKILVFAMGTGKDDDESDDW